MSLRIFMTCRSSVAAERIPMIANAAFVATLIFLALGFWPDA